MTETLDSIRDFAAGIARRLQEECAEIAAAARDQSAMVIELQQRDIACRLQRSAASRHAAAFEALDWTLDEPFLAEWCQNINRRHEEEMRERDARIARESARLAAMTREQRAQYERELQAQRVCTLGVLRRDVQ